MTKKHFQLIADAIMTARAKCLAEDSVVIDIVARCLAKELESSNNAFDEKRFLQACGVPEK